MNEIHLLIQKNWRLPVLANQALFPAREKAKVLSFTYINELRLMENKNEKFSYDQKIVTGQTWKCYERRWNREKLKKVSLQPKCQDGIEFI